LGLQIFSGLFLASHFCSSTLFAFDSVLHIISDVYFGWLFRIIHLNGASFFFVFLYLHIGRGLYYGSYRIKETWNLGVVIVFLRIIIAFVGYVLPWGQISFWGATVITNLISAIPLCGPKIVLWVWGGFSVGEPTLSRFFIIHFLSPFLLRGVVLIHIFFLHSTGRRNPLSSNSKYNVVPFHTYLRTKDFFFFFCCFFFVFFFFFSSALLFRGCGKLYFSQSFSNSRPHCARMILFICLCYSTFHSR
jgi:ubiquinol-cytochrome c reductase cytochrome b subunit